jgi:hypothetical protein
LARVVWISLGLVLLNLMLFLWPQSDDRSNLAAPEINASQLQLLSEVRQPEPVEESVEQLVAALPEAQETTAEQILQQASEPQIAALIDQELDQENEGSSCYKIGPFVNINVFTMTRARLDQLQIPFTLGQVGPRSATVVRLFSGPYESYAQAEAAQIGLRERGLMDHFIKPDGETWVLSIGVFAEPDRAEQRLLLLQRRDPSIKLRVEYGEIPPGSWVIVEYENLSKAESAELLTIPWHESGVELSVSPCGAPLIVEGEGVVGAG